MRILDRYATWVLGVRVLGLCFSVVVSSLRLGFGVFVSLAPTTFEVESLASGSGLLVIKFFTPSSRLRDNMLSVKFMSPWVKSHARPSAFGSEK